MTLPRICRAGELVATHRAGFEQWWGFGVRIAPRRLGPALSSDAEGGDLLLDDVDDDGPVRWSFQLADVLAAMTGPGRPSASELDPVARRAAFHARHAFGRDTVKSRMSSSSTRPAGVAPPR